MLIFDKSNSSITISLPYYFPLLLKIFSLIFLIVTILNYILILPLLKLYYNQNFIIISLEYSRIFYKFLLYTRI